MADIVLVNPRFEVSYWGLQYALPILGKRASAPPGCLPLLAALTPDEHRVRIVDENVQPLRFEQLARADIVGVTGIGVQRERMLEILSELKRRGVFTVVGGAWATVQDDDFDGQADAVFLGEADESWPQFLGDWQCGRAKPRYQQGEATDLTRLPIPRYELLPMRHYLFHSVQFSRGCPFGCEFCDVIVTFGRRWRAKRPAQVMAELDVLRRQGAELVFLADDNLIGNRIAALELLAQMIAWQQVHGYPLTFFCQASLNLAEDDELMRRMAEANVQVVFVGIESPNAESLREVGKWQNLSHDPLPRVERIQQSGMEVWGGMMLGLDHDDSAIFAAHRDLVTRARIMHAQVSMLTAIPRTPLYERLLSEGRLEGQQSAVYGTNVVPRQISREALRDGYVRLMLELYEPQAYFARYEDLYLRDDFRVGEAQRKYWCEHAWNGLKSRARLWAACALVYRRLVKTVHDGQLNRIYRGELFKLFTLRRDPRYMLALLVKCAAHYHYWTMARHMAEGRTPVLNPF